MEYMKDAPDAPNRSKARGTLTSQERMRSRGEYMEDAPRTLISTQQLHTSRMGNSIKYEHFVNVRNRLTKQGASMEAAGR